MTHPRSADVVVVGGGVVGVSTAYFLSEAGLSTVVVERDSVGSHASGFAYGGLSGLVGPGPIQPLARDGMRIHRELAESLPEQTGTNTEFRYRPALALALTEEDAEAARGRAGLADGRGRLRSPLGRAGRGRVDRVSRRRRHLRRRIHRGHGRPGAVPLHARARQGGGAAGRLGRDRARDGTDKAGRPGHRSRVGRRRDRRRARGACDGPVGRGGSELAGFVRADTPAEGPDTAPQGAGPPIRTSIGWDGNYAVTKPDGLVWTGTTEEEVGFDERPSAEAREQITRAFMRVLPFLGEAGADTADGVSTADHSGPAAAPGPRSGAGERLRRHRRRALWDPPGAGDGQGRRRPDRDGRVRHPGRTLQPAAVRDLAA